MRNQLDHTYYMKKVKTMTNESLRFVIQDCQQAIKSFPNGEKAGWYQDEIHYCSMELNKRKK